MDSNDKRALLTRKISDYFGALCALTDESARSDAVRGYLQAAAVLRGFSLNNQLLILMQHPIAEPMAGFHAWRKLGRQVRKGEHGAAIFVPMRRKAPAEDEQDTAPRRAFFGIGYVFGQSQTEGEPLPQPPVWTSTEGWGDFERVLERVAESFGLSVERVHASGRARGVLDGQHIRLAHDAGSKTLLHELAHHVTLALLDTQNTAAREHVAEAVTYITARVYGRAVQSAPNYLALWHANADALKARLAVISSGVRALAARIDAELAQCAPGQSHVPARVAGADVAVTGADVASIGDRSWCLPRTPEGDGVERLAVLAAADPTARVAKVGYGAH